MNRLAESTSDYLLQHAHQPVDWWPWCDEAFLEAQQLEKPILLSVGYASCHWCHVMSHESFNDADVAAYINEHFVPIKVDRQQHPDVDSVYMAATQAMNQGQGGWPMTAFLTPTGQPFFTGTYFPPQAAQGMPSFMTVLEAMADAWRTRRDEVVASGAALVEQLSALDQVARAERPDSAELVLELEKQFDLLHGGFGHAPKFPPSTLLPALLVKGDPRSMEMAQRTLETMARGALYDQVGGGFHRYSVDAGWVVPHFEKMLNDNALLLSAYVDGFRRTAAHDEGLRDLFRRVIERTVDFLEREMRLEEGAFASALDADSSDIRGMVAEGIFYLWSPELLLDALGEERAEWAIETFHVTTGGTFDEGLSTLQLRGRPDFATLDAVCDALLAERANRFRPATDRLVVAGWNGLAILGLIQAAGVLKLPKALDLARAAAHYLRDVHVQDGVLWRSSFAGVPHREQALAEDYGAVAEAFATLGAATGDFAWVTLASELVERALNAFGADDGGFFDAADVGLYTRPRSLSENVTPSGTMAMVRALRVVGALTDRRDFLERADRAAATSYATVASHPRFAGAALQDLMIHEEAEKGLGRAVVVVTEGSMFTDLACAAWRMAPAGSVIVVAEPGQPCGQWLTGREPGMAYVCRNSTCFEPVSQIEELKTALWRRA